MALSKSTRIMILLAVDTCFFFIELIFGSAVHSLALVADSFHMLNDVISLLVGLWAVKVAQRDTDSKMYTYGWQRAETLGALVNGVFLIALCLSIFLEAIQRFVEPQEVSQPKVILVVGCLGLLSNIAGLFLFHDHGHGGHGHDHGHSHDEEYGDPYHEEEEEEPDTIRDESGNIADILPQTVVANWPSQHKKQSSRTGTNKDDEHDHKHSIAASPESRRKLSLGTHQRHGSASHGRYASFSESSGHPHIFRQEIIERSSEVDPPSPIMSEGEDNEDDHRRDLEDPTESTPLLNGAKKDHGHSHGQTNHKSQELKHAQHNHRSPKKESQSGGHSHGDLNMRGVFLHVMGDALGNIGVISTALFIWLTDYSWRFYTDPAISLVITVIILCSAIPLCKAASKILLQAVPAGLSIDEIKKDIQGLDGVISCHHIHVWQLSDTKLVASLHIVLGFDFKGAGKEEYMKLSREIRRRLRGYGIRNPTIQAEFCLDNSHTHEADGATTPNGSIKDDVDKHSGPSACVWESGDREQTCCSSETRKP